MQYFLSVMPLLLTDNGSEFSKPKALEFDRQGNRRTHIFYCDPSAPRQKGSAEKNHEFIRYVLPKGISFNGLSQTDISLLMNHINFYSRESLGNKCPYNMFQFLYGNDILSSLGCHKIAPNDVILTPTLLRKQQYSPNTFLAFYNSNPPDISIKIQPVQEWHLLWQKNR
ncbi:MAG: hypothetical protein J6J79_00065 [Lachnospiraceae bacterium]|nr:hypothetical protein [Lachnospiraceae bacterium]